jgi:hypothetical protein
MGTTQVPWSTVYYMQTITYISGAQFYSRIRKVRTVVYEPDDRATDIEIIWQHVTCDATAVTTILYDVVTTYRLI